VATQGAPLGVRQEALRSAELRSSRAHICQCLDLPLASGGVWAGWACRFHPGAPPRDGSSMHLTPAG
jgi:hypothetical protein